MQLNLRTLAMSPTEVQEKLRLSQLKDKIWYVVPSCATTGEGLFEGLVCLLILRLLNSTDVISQGWLSNNVKAQPQKQLK